MITASKLDSYTLKDLAQMAKRSGIRGWHSMRKAELVKALKKPEKPTRARGARNGKSHPAATTKAKKAPAKNGTSRSKANGTVRAKATTKAKATKKAAANGTKAKLTKSPAKAKKSAKPKTPANPRIVKKIQQAAREKEIRMDISTTNGDPLAGKDRVILMVRDPYWLHVCWELTGSSIERARAALAESWPIAVPALRLLRIEGQASNKSQTVESIIEIHGGVKNWYINLETPPGSYRVEIGYSVAGERFHVLAKSNLVETPKPDCVNSIDENWSDVAANYEKVYAISGGYSTDGTTNELQELFEERLQRPMSAPSFARFGVGADCIRRKDRDFIFELNTELIIHGKTTAESHVTMVGEPVQLNEDGTFAVRLNLGNKRQVMPLVANSPDGVEQRTIILSVERNTKVMEPIIHDIDEQTENKP